MFRTFAAFMLGCLSLAGMWGLGKAYADGFSLTLHSTRMPLPDVIFFNGTYTLFGGLAAGAFAVAIGGLLEHPPLQRRLGPILGAVSDRMWISCMAGLALLVPILLHFFLLKGAPLTDDEGAYFFAAELLASGRLYVPTHPMPEFFDRIFLINEERRYAQYFLGWPALLAPGVLLGLPWLMNPLCAAATIPPVFWVTRRVGSTHAAYIATLLLVTSPMLQLLAATSLSHTSCLMALAWATWFALRSRDADAPPWVHGALAAALSLAVFIRPLTAIALAAPLLFTWVMGLLRKPVPWKPVAWFVGVAGLGASLFFAVNTLQHGHPLQNGYEAYWNYLHEVNFRNSSWRPHKRGGSLVPNLFFRLDHRALATLGSSLYRMNYVWLGWPISLLFVLYAPLRGEQRTITAMLGLGVLFAMIQKTPGVDTVGPVHIAEIALPMTIVSSLGIAALIQHTRGTALAGPARGLLPAMITVAFTVYVPIRFEAVHAIAEMIRTPYRIVEEQGLEDAVVFYDRAFSRQCPKNHYVYGGPANDPTLANSVLYVRDHGTRRNRAFMTKHFATRTGYTLTVKKCQYALNPLALGDPK